MITDQHTPPGLKFFMPGVQPGGGRPEAAYRQLRLAVAQTTGSEPAPERIFGLKCQLGGRNSRIEVGQPDPIQSNVVLAIFDVGGERPYVVYTMRDRLSPAFRLGKSVKSVTAFA